MTNKTLQPIAWMWINKETNKQGVIFEDPANFYDMSKQSNYIWQPLYLKPTSLPDAITDNSESPEFRAGWNECREVMAGMLK